MPSRRGNYTSSSFDESSALGCKRELDEKIAIFIKRGDLSCY
jgi:hypothetical protein